LGEIVGFSRRKAIQYENLTKNFQKVNTIFTRKWIIKTGDFVISVSNENIEAH